MTVTVKALVPSKYIEDAQTTQYTATNVTALLDSISVFNDTGGAITLDVHIVNSGGSASAANIFISRSIASGEYYNCPELTGQVLRSGDLVSMIAGTASSLTLRISGREIS